ncbi:MAG: hypothetical protein IPM53_32945 [Anaerolineaceae bacterium]|nr:hypothetical protein [Anaerolineaceae bacterium]
MNDKEIRQALQEIAADKVGKVDLWAEIEARVKRPYRFNIWQFGVRLAGTAVVVLALILFISWLASLSQSSVTDDGPETTVETPMRSTSFTLDPGLVYPEAPATLPRYEVSIVPSPQTPEEMLAWATAFGQPDPKIFRDPHSSELLLSVGSDGSSLSFFREYYWINYLSRDWRDATRDDKLGEKFSFAEGAAIAESFLAEHGQLPAVYHVVDQFLPFFSADRNTTRIFQFAFDLNGYPVLHSINSPVGPSVSINAAGEVFSAGFAEAEFKEVDTVQLRSAEEVVNEFVNGRLNPLAQHFQPAFDTQPGYTTYTPALPKHTLGEQVTVLETDDTDFLVAEDGSEVRATLVTRPGANYELNTPDLAHIAGIVENDDLLVTGTIAAQITPDTWRLDVDSWEILRQQVITSGCAIGPVSIEESGAWIVAESVIGEVVRNGRYQLNNLPAEVQNGEHIEVCAEPIPASGESLPWSVLYAPPRDLSQSPKVSDTYVIEEVRLVYFHDMEDPALALAQPAWMVSGHAPGSASRFVAYLDAVQR